MRSVADSELGALTTTTEYLPNLQVKTTNPRNHATTQTLWALDQLGEAKLRPPQRP